MTVELQATELHSLGWFSDHLEYLTSCPSSHMYCPTFSFCNHFDYYNYDCGSVFIITTLTITISVDHYDYDYTRSVAQ